MTARSSLAQSATQKAASASFPSLAYLCSTLVGIISVFVAFGLVLHSSYLATKQLAIQTSASIGALIEQDITRNLEFYNLSFQAVIDGIKNPRLMALDPTLRQLALFDRSATAEGLGSILVLDENGNPVLDSRTTKLPQVNFADRDYFQVHRSRVDAGLYISLPLQSRIRNQADWIMCISRRLSHRDGSFAGVIVGAISLSYFQKVFQKVDLEKDSAIILFHTSGRFVARYPFVASVIGQKAGRNDGLFDHYEKAPSGTYENMGLDGVERLYHYHRIGSLPLILDVGLSTNAIFTHWWHQALTTTISLLALCVLVLIMTVRVGRELRRRQQAEDQLAILAATDSLTGLANRRKFDASLASEWTRSCRSGMPISLLMIDTDLFKSFNDDFGHQAGDEALKAIAQCFQTIVQRQPDLVARYGGEEFAILLPNTDEADARHVAEAVRTAVENLDLTYLIRSCRKLTLSIGIGTKHASHDEEAGKLVRDADRALYIAKSSGRNRVCSTSDKLTLVPTAACKSGPSRA